MMTGLSSVGFGEQRRRQFPTMRRRHGLVLAILFLLPAASARAIDVVEHRWGFNGKVAPHRFNLLTVLINNPTPQTFTGEVILKKTLGGAGSVDATIVEMVTVSPNSQKWVQFYPYITSEYNYGGTINEVWRINYRGGSFEVPAPHLAKYQRIILDDPNSVLAKSSSTVKFHFPDNLFPPFVSATDALQLAVLDHEPRWEESRRQSFLDWVYLGGTVVLLHDSSGKFPDFSGPMSPLKSPLDNQLYGMGRIVKIAQTRSQFSEEDYLRICAGLPKNFVTPNPNSPSTTNDIVDRVDESLQASQAQNFNYNEITDPFKSSLFLTELKQMTKPSHNWLLLHLMFWVYIVLVFPGCYLLGKKWADFRVVYAGLLGTVIVFSFLFSIVGQRGYGESTAVHSLAIARPLPNGQMDIADWSNVFVTAGADYEIQHNSNGTLYSTCNDHEQVKGLINNGSNGMFKVDIPPFSNRELAMRGKIASEQPKVSINAFRTLDDRLTELSLNVEGLKQADVESQFVLIGNVMYSLKWESDKLILAGESESIAGTLRVADLRQNQYGMRYRQNNQMEQTQRYRELFNLLLSRGLNISRERDADQFRVPANLIQVGLYAKFPSEFAIQSKQLSNQDGRVLYLLTLPLTDSKGPG